MALETKLKYVQHAIASSICNGFLWLSVKDSIISIAFLNTILRLGIITLHFSWDFKVSFNPSPKNMPQMLISKALSPPFLQDYLYLETTKKNRSPISKKNRASLDGVLLGYCRFNRFKLNRLDQMPSIF